jgi:hypothetical protein
MSDAPQITSTQEWKSGRYVELTVPSGKTCLAKRPDGMQVFMKMGMVPNALMPIVERAIKEGKAAGEQLKDDGYDPSEMMNEVIKDPEKLSAIVDLVDAITCHCVVQPVVKPVPRGDEGDIVPDSEREDGDFLYVDWVDMTDKMFIFNWSVGGTSDLESFREQQATLVEAISTGPGMEDEAERPAED